MEQAESRHTIAISMKSIAVDVSCAPVEVTVVCVTVPACHIGIVSAAINALQCFMEFAASTVCDIEVN